MHQGTPMHMLPICIGTPAGSGARRGQIQAALTVDRTLNPGRAPQADNAHGRRSRRQDAEVNIDTNSYHNSLEASAHPTGAF
jgi:hypothetical protein